MPQYSGAQTAKNPSGQLAFANTDKAGNLLVSQSNESHVQVAASQTAALLGAVGAVGDELGALIIIPATTSPGAVSITDGNGSAITIFTGGATSVADLKPIVVPLNTKCSAATNPGWRVTTGANVSVVAVGNFT